VSDGSENHTSTHTSSFPPSVFALFLCLLNFTPLPPSGTPVLVHRKMPGAKESTWDDDDSFLSSESSDGSTPHRQNRGKVEVEAEASQDSKPPLSVTPMQQPTISPSPLSSVPTNGTNSSSTKSKRKRRKSKAGAKKHKKNKKVSVNGLGPSTSKKHRKCPSVTSRRKVHPATSDGDSSTSGNAASVATATTLTNGISFDPIGLMPSNVLYSVPHSAEETENTIVMAVREIRRYRERIAELEMLVRHLSESYGVDPESLLMAESMGASEGSTVLRKGTRGLRVSVEDSHTATVSATAEVSSQPDLTLTDEMSMNITTPSTMATTPVTQAAPSLQMPGVVCPPQKRHTMYLQPIERTPLSEEQKMANIMNKLQKLTGRKMSLEEISPLLHARTADEALRNGKMLRTAEHLKRVYGGRPENYVLSPPQRPVDDKKLPSSPVHRHQHQHSHHQHQTHSHSPQSHNKEDSKSPDVDAEPVPINPREKARLRKKKSRSVFDFTSLNPIDGEDEFENKPSPNGTGGGNRESAAGELAGGSTFGRKIEKLTRLTGRRGSITEIRSLLLPNSPEEAKKCAQSLYTMEKLKKRYGERPTMDHTPQQP